MLGTILDCHKAANEPEFNARVSEFNRRLVLHYPRPFPRAAEVPAEAKRVTS